MKLSTFSIIAACLFSLVIFSSGSSAVTGFIDYYELSKVASTTSKTVSIQIGSNQQSQFGIQQQPLNIPVKLMKTRKACKKSKITSKH